MNNLGWYQWFTTNAKKVGGPLRLMGLIAVGGYAIIRTVEAGAKKSIKVVKARHKRALNDELPICNVTADGSIEKDVRVKRGDQIKICAIDGNAVMIEVIGNENNPYFIDMKRLKSLTDYK